MIVRIDTLKQRKAESRRLARTRLRKGNKVVVAVEQYRYNFFLYRHGILEAHVSDAAQQIVAYT